MNEHIDEEDVLYENDEIPQDEEFVPRKKIVIGKQLLLIIQLIICGLALLFMVIIKLIGGSFCENILSWYETKYYDSIYPSEDGKNNISIFGFNSSQSNTESSGKSENKTNSTTDTTGSKQSKKNSSKSETE